MVAMSESVSAESSDGTAVTPVTEKKPTAKISLAILADITTAQAAHGLKHSDYARYRAYCTRRLSRLRSATATSNKHPSQQHRYVAHVVTSDDILSNERALAVPLVQAERDWAFAMDVKRTQPAGPARARRRVLAKLSRAVHHASALSTLCRAIADEETVLEAQAYASGLRAALALEREAWSTALAAYDVAHKIYTGMAGVRAGTSGAAVFERRLEDVTQAIRFCRYNMARDGDTDGNAEDSARLLEGLRADADAAASSDVIAEKIEAALAEARRRAAQSLGSVTWCGVDVPLRAERVREAVHVAEEAVTAFGGREVGVDDYDKLFVTLGDSARVVSEEAREFRAAAGASDARVRELELLEAYLSHKRLTHTVARNLLLVESLRARRGAKPEDFVRLYDNLIGNMTDVLALPGVDEDAATANETEARRSLFRMQRCFYLAQCYQQAGLQAEAAALFDRVGAHARVLGGKHKVEGEKIVAESAGMKYRARAEAFLEVHKATQSISTLGLTETTNASGRAVMVDHLDKFESFAPSEDGSRAICNMPPSLEAVPCKPVLFDLAIDGVKPPSSDDDHEDTNADSAKEAKQDSAAAEEATPAPAPTPSTATSTASAAFSAMSSTRLGRWWAGKS